MIMNKLKYKNSNIDFIFIDFDGVLTNNLVYLDSKGNEIVACSRADGIAFDVLKKFDVNIFIISSEKNNVVKKRSQKLKIPCFNGVSDKLITVKNILKKKKSSFSQSLYVGNDLNDYDAMKICKFRAAPSDSHQKIRKISNIKLKSKGGDGVIRELLEYHFCINLLHFL